MVFVVKVFGRRIFGINYYVKERKQKIRQRFGVGYFGHKFIKIGKYDIILWRSGKQLAKKRNIADKARYAIHCSPEVSSMSIDHIREPKMNDMKERSL